MKLNDFLELSDLDHTKLRHSGFSFIIRPKECAPDKDSRISNYILSQPVFTTKGVGHLTYSGEFNPKESNVINGFEFFAETLEDIKNKNYTRTYCNTRKFTRLPYVQWYGTTCWWR